MVIGMMLLADRHDVISQLFGCDLADFLRETSNRPTEQGMVISQQLAKLDTTDRELVLEVVGKLAARLAR